MYLQVSTSVLRDNHEVRVVALYEVDEVFLLLVRYDDLLPLLLLQPQACLGNILSGTPSNIGLTLILGYHQLPRSYLGSLANSVIVIFYLLVMLEVNHFYN